MIQDELLDLLGAKKGASRGQSIREGKVTGLLSHFLHSAEVESRNRVWEIFNRLSGDTSDEDIAEVLDLMERQGTFQYAVDLIREHQNQVLEKSTSLDPKLMNALTSITEVFLKPLLDRLEA
jgi:geranylgeranyl pyrophosphate synthase